MTSERSYIANAAAALGDKHAGTPIEKYRPYRNKSDDWIAAKLAEFRKWVADPNAFSKAYPSMRITELEAEQRERELERAGKGRVGA